MARGKHSGYARDKRGRFAGAKGKASVNAAAPKMSGAWHKGKQLTQTEYNNLIAKAQSQGKQVIHRTELGPRRKVKSIDPWVSQGLRRLNREARQPKK